jgi:hypothetical protein
LSAAPALGLPGGSRRQRFLAPARGQVEPRCWASPLYAAHAAHADWLRGPAWPDLAELTAALGGAIHPHSGQPLRFVAQDRDLLADGLHYERRILERGRIATREGNWHDLFNALVWLAHPGIKAAINLRQVQDLCSAGAQARTRSQCALTHFDEAGAVVLLRDPVLLACWDTHDWPGLFHAQAMAWRDGRAEVAVIGHALLEQGLAPHALHTAKCVVVLDDRIDLPEACRRVAAALAGGALLQDPQQLRPLPLSGIPGWHPQQDEAFYRSAACFRPLRPGRCYPPPLRF